MKPVVYQCVNPTPVPFQNPAWVGPMVRPDGSNAAGVPMWIRQPVTKPILDALKFDPLFCPGEGQANGAQRWSANGIPRTAADMEAAGLTAGGVYIAQPDESPVEAKDPATFALAEQQAFQAISRLCLDSTTYDGVSSSGLATPIGVILDCETKSYALGDNQTQATNMRTIDRFIQLATWMRQVNQSLTLGVFGYPQKLADPTCANAMRLLADLLDWAVFSPYVWEQDIRGSGELWYQKVEEALRIFTDHFPDLQPIAMLCPTYQPIGALADNPDMAGLRGTGIGVERFRAQCQFLADRGCDLCLWIEPWATIPDFPDYAQAMASVR